MSSEFTLSFKDETEISTLENRYKRIYANTKREGKREKFRSGI